MDVNTLYSFTGNLNYLNVTQLLTEVEKSIFLKIGNKFAEQVTNLLIESLNNIIQHNDDIDCLNATINITHFENRVVVIVQSIIKKSDALVIKLNVLKLAQYNIKQLQELLSSAKNQESLGFVKMAIITNNNFSMSFTDTSNSSSLYELILEVS